MRPENLIRETPAAADRQSSSWRATAGLLRADRFLRVSLVVYGVALVFLGAVWVQPESLAGEFQQLVDPVLLGLTLVALLWGRRRTKGRERLFWDLLASAWACWLLVDVIFFFELPVPLVSAAFATDSLYILYYLIFALAVDLRPHLESARSLTLVRRRLESIAGLLAIFGLLFYFGIVVLPEPLGFSLSFVPRDRGLTTQLLVRLSLDVLVLARLVYAVITARDRWSRLYLLLAVGMFFYLLRDALALLQYERMISISSQGFAYTAFLYLPGFLVLVAARYRHLPFTESPARESVTDPEETDEVIRPSPIALYALLVPTVHFLLFPLELLDEASRSPREVFCLVYVLALGTLAWIHQAIVAKDARHYRRALRETEKRLFRSQRLEAVGRLAGGIAHDFNNYLTVISGYGELVRTSVEDEEVQNDVAYIEEAASKAEHLTRQLLAFGRRQVLKPVAVDLNEIVRETAKLLRSLLGEDVRLELELDPGTGLALADVGQTEQVLMNLAINSRDAMPGGGTLSIRTYRAIFIEEEAARLEVAPGSYVCLVVSDTGLGMNQEVQAQMFEPFFTTKRRGRGNGLGLSTVYGIVAQSHGAIRVESAPGRGTTVTVLLPTAKVSELPESRPAVELASGRAGATLLLVEDEEAVRRMAVRALSEGGFRVLQAASGQEALSLPPDSRDVIDLLITDVVMPGMDGTELAARLIDHCPGLRVLFVSGYPTETLRERRTALPSSMCFLHKPFTPTALVAAVREALDEPAPTGGTGRHALLDTSSPC
jgi:signal transduction histidine kinase/CheY-like chemotaxis protein